jgi:hypothetical protein
MSFERSFTIAAALWRQLRMFVSLYSCTVSMAAKSFCVPLARAQLKKAAEFSGRVDLFALSVVVLPPTQNWIPITYLVKSRSSS